MQQLNRVTPAIGAEHYKTYAISAPISTHFRPGTCEEAECGAYRNGWKTSVDESTDLGQQQAHYIRKLSRRRFTAVRVGALTEFTFEAGQACFRSPHQVPLERDPLFLVKGGDFRGNPRGDQTVTRKPEDWVDDFATHQNNVAAAVQRG